LRIISATPSARIATISIGELRERNVGEIEHSDLLGQFIELLDASENKIWIRANPTLRVEVRPSNFRVPDVCVRPRSAPKQR
jgi:hypothetical protein